MRIPKFLKIGLPVAIALILLTVFFCDLRVRNEAAGKLYSDTSKLPVNKTGLLLGTAKLLKNGTVNPYYQYRIDAAAQLIKAGKIRYLIISGDNSRKAYNEPEDMRQDLIRVGIDSSIIYLDYAGFRTFDSMVRLKEIFGQTSVTVISQPFHNERAIYLAGTLGINAIGYNARDVAGSSGTRVQLREKLARVNVFLDGFFGTEPKFLGEKVMLPAN